MSSIEKAIGLVLQLVKQKRVVTFGGAIIGSVILLSLLYQFASVAEWEVPQIVIDTNKSPYNASKVALLVENRASPIIAPIMVHMMSVVPPDFRFQFIGTEASIAMVEGSAALRPWLDVGKVYTTLLPDDIDTGGQEQISRFFTNPWVYKNLIMPAEWLLVYQTDSILCANSLDSIQNYLDYDWVGAPWDPNGRYGGNGGLSMRKVSSIMKVLEHQERIHGSAPEDVWLSERLGHLHDTKVANGSISFHFSGEQMWVDEPMGYHTGGSGAWLGGGLFGTPHKRQQIYDWCPEIALGLSMDIETYFDGNFCNTNW